MVEVGQGEDRRKGKIPDAAMLMSMLFLFLASSFVAVAVQFAAVDETSGESKLNLFIPHVSFSAKKLKISHNCARCSLCQWNGNAPEPEGRDVGSEKLWFRDAVALAP